jgi:acetylornithine/succinyldiaminopimelate/putrescine aminotransferase
MEQGALLLKDLRQFFNSAVEIRGKGLFIGIEVKKGDVNKLCEEMIEQGVLAKPTQKTIIRLAPALTIKDEQRKEIV